MLNVRLVVIRLKREAVILRERERGWKGGGRGDGESAGHLCRFCPAVFQVGARGGLYVLGLAGQDESLLGKENPIVSLGHPDMERCWSHMDTDTLTHNHMTSKNQPTGYFGSHVIVCLCCGWLPEHCCAVSGVLLVVARALLEWTVCVLTSSHQPPSLLDILVSIYGPGSFNYVSLSDLLFSILIIAHLSSTSHWVITVHVNSTK